MDRFLNLQVPCASARGHRCAWPLLEFKVLLEKVLKKAADEAIYQSISDPDLGLLFL